MRLLRAGAAVLALATATAACSSGDTGSQGGWRVSRRRISIEGAAPPCPTPAPVLDTFSSTPTPQPGCSAPPAKNAGGDSSPEPSAAPAGWQPVHTEAQYHSSTSQWHPIYTTYTAPPGTGIYQPMVSATNQPMPTPFSTPTPQPTPSTPVVSTQAPIIAPSSVP